MLRRFDDVFDKRALSFSPAFSTSNSLDCDASVTATLYDLPIVRISENPAFKYFWASSIYKKLGFLVYSLPGRLKMEDCKLKIIKYPKYEPNSRSVPRAVEINKHPPSARILSKSISDTPFSGFKILRKCLFCIRLATCIRTPDALSYTLLRSEKYSLRNHDLVSWFCFASESLITGRVTNSLTRATPLPFVLQIRSFNSINVVGRLEIPVS